MYEKFPSSPNVMNRSMDIARASHSPQRMYRNVECTFAQKPFLTFTTYGDDLIGALRQCHHPRPPAERNE